MIYTTQNSSPRFAVLPANTAIEIIQHKEIDNIIIFTYSIPIDINQSLIGEIDGDLQVRGFLGQKKNPAVTVKKSIVTGGNILKNINQQRLKSISDVSLRRRNFFKKDIARSDFSLSSIDFQVDVSSADIDDSFIVEIANIRTDGFVSLIDSIVVDHSSALRKYDLPSRDFVLTATRLDNKKIYVSAVSNDDVVGSFKFFIKNNSLSNFIPSSYDTFVEVPLVSTNIATATFNVSDVDQVHSVIAKPISKFLRQEIGNFRQFETGFVKNIKMLPIYMETITDKSVSFRIVGIDQTIDLVMLYRQLLPGGNRTFVASSQNLQDGLVIEDRYRNPQYDFIYSVDYIDSSGITHTSPSEVLVPALKLDTLANLTVNQVKDQDIDVEGQFITFDITVSYKTSTIVDQITKDLKTLGLENLLSSELEKTTNNLKPLIRVLVTQISMVTGVEYDVGIYEPGIVKLPIDEDLLRDSIYRFEVAVRSVPEALENITAAQDFIALKAYDLKSEVDLSSKIIGNKAKSSRTSYSAKFFTKNSIRNSLLRYGNSSTVGDTTFYAGRTGIFYDIRITNDVLEPASISNLRFLSTSKGNYITWGFAGSSRSIDYFEINLDGIYFYSHPSDGTSQIFHLGSNRPRIIEIMPVKYGRRNELGKAKIEVQ